MKNDSFFAKVYNYVEGISELTEENTRIGEEPAKENISGVSEDELSNAWLTETESKEKTFRGRMTKFLQTRGIRLYEEVYHLAAILICIATILVMLYMVSEMPPFGSNTNPAVNEVPTRYLEKAIEDTGTTNAVSGMISGYRGFDTLGEAHVLFIAAVSVIILLRVDNPEETAKKSKMVAEMEEEDKYEPHHSVILQKTARFAVPFILIFGIYVILNGTISPGGGFSGGTILGAGLILYSAAFQFYRTRRFFNDETYHVVKTTCLTLYTVLMAYFIFMGANGLDNLVPLGIPGSMISGGIIFLINIAVGLEVACTMYCFYALFRRGRL